MFNQVAILSDVIRREHALATSPARLERRRLAHAMAATRFRSGGASSSRLRAAVGGSAARCCATG
jgi:hypothetical protein